MSSNDADILRDADPKEIKGSQSSFIASLEEFLATDFDYLVLGGGTAGCVIAGRLAENPDITVGVVEAGKYRKNDPLVDTPTALGAMFENPEYDWCCYTAPQKYNKNIIHNMPRGKMLGGSSGINAMMYVRGSEADYDSWAHVVGDEGWNSKSMLRYMKKHEAIQDIDVLMKDHSTYHYKAESHGVDGPIHTSFNDNKMEVDDAVIKAFNDHSSTTFPPDAWSGDHIGFTSGLGAISRTDSSKGKRSYAVNYLEGSQHGNLKVLCEANVNSIILAGNKAIGAHFTIGGREYSVWAKNEIIVCGGVVKSPQILELSGIGDPEVLRQAGVECKVENKGVGANLQDHVATFLMVDVKPGVFTLDRLHSQPEVVQAAAKQYTESGSGPLSNVFGTTGFVAFKTIVSPEEFSSTIRSIKNTKPTSEFHRLQLEEIVKQLESDTSANIQMVMFPTTVSPDGIKHQSKLLNPRNDGAGLSFLVCGQYPVSRGSVHIVGSDPTTPPVIQPNYGGHEADQILLAAALRWTDGATKNKHLAEYLQGRTWPPPEYDLNQLQQGVTAVEEIVLGEYHACGSVSMGDALDSRLRVKGAQNLRVVDASIFPGNVSGNIASTVYALAEKAADLIKEDMVQTEQK